MISIEGQSHTLKYPWTKVKAMYNFNTIYNYILLKSSSVLLKTDKTRVACMFSIVTFMNINKAPLIK